jgi:protein involved in polysaccharide export with SLBB domain
MPGDLLFISFAGEKDYDQQVRVDLNGRISLRFLTQDSAVDFRRRRGVPTSPGASSRQRNEVLINPRSVLVVEFSTQAFVVLGRVTLPGRYTFPRDWRRG